jgi:HD superfamily phosphohydrolase
VDVQVTSLRWDDRVYGPSTIDDSPVLDLIRGPSFERLRGIRQAGPSALVYPNKTVTRFEHSLGVYLLLRRLGADRREQVAGLLHDISHTAFSHAVDFVYASIEQDHHEQLKPQILHRPDVARPLAAMGYRPEAFYDDSVYPLLEQPLPGLCADRLDYFLRDSLAVGVSSPESVARVLDALVVVDGLIALKSAEVARDTVERFAVMNRDYYASRAEAFIYNEFGDALREGLRLGVLDDDVLLTDDATVLDRLRTSGSPLILEKLARLEQFCDADLEGFEARIVPKQRWLDPPVLVDGGTWRPLSGL